MGSVQSPAEKREFLSLHRYQRKKTNVTLISQKNQTHMVANAFEKALTRCLSYCPPYFEIIAFGRECQTYLNFTPTSITSQNGT